MEQTNEKNDFTKGTMAQNILRLAVPITFAQIVNLLYNIVDRIFIGHIPEASTLALAGVGITFPIITIITAFTNLFGMGGSPLFSIARGRKQDSHAANIMGNSFFMLLVSGVVLSILCYLVKKPVLYLFGASDVTYPYADSYISIYLIGTIFVMISLGMNPFINAQGFARRGMLTVLIGAVCNLILDPVFIFGFHMGVAGAAVATILSQGISALWVLFFLCGRKTIIAISFKSMKPQISLILEIIELGMSGFVMSITNSAVQIVCNATLHTFGGDLYVSIMAILNSIREVVHMPSQGITGASSPVLGFNFGAKEYSRVKSGIRFTSLLCIGCTCFAWGLLLLFPSFFIRIFSSDAELLKEGIHAMLLYFFGIFMMALQFAGQSVFVALGKSRQAIFFSLFRKIIIVVPLTILLPHIASLGVDGVFLAEPVSNFIGGTACYLTMYLTVYRKLGKDII